MPLHKNITLLRSLIHEFRMSFCKQYKVKESSQYEYILQQFRQNIVTDLQYCRERDELFFIAQTYATYLNSRRHLKNLHEEYHGKGERSTEETAQIVGFKLPHDPR